MNQPHTSWPRGLSRIQAASYVGLGTTFFDQKVADRTFPKPIEIGKRKIWDKHDLDSAFETLKRVDFDSLKPIVPTSEKNDWDN